MRVRKNRTKRSKRKKRQNKTKTEIEREWRKKMSEQSSLRNFKQIQKTEKKFT